jgi:hypothetical protein
MKEFWKYVGGFCCCPLWTPVVFLILIKYVKKPSDLQDPERQHGFPVVPKKPHEKPGENKE